MPFPAPTRDCDARSQRRVALERIWIAATVGYGLLRACLVAATLSQYGVNPWSYLIIDVATSVPLGLSTARVIGALVDRDLRTARTWAIVAVLTDFAPDIFIVIVGRDMPMVVYVALGVIAVASVGFGVRSILRKVASMRRVRAEACEAVLLPAA
jgi:hypothetical protein